ncbi:MAG TPA: hypothetical protein VFK85_05035, partial [Anaeromyxobacteraceae bacterium]|nr:hypothetical protein [Anaeromyxobacteraceae bacterium]
MSIRFPIQNLAVRDELAPRHTRAFDPPRRALVVGAAGGVGHAVRTLLARTPAGAKVSSWVDEILLLDAVGATEGPRPARSRWLPPQRIASAEGLARLAREHRVDHVVDLSSLGTLDCVEACDALGVAYLTTSVEHWPDRPIPWTELVGAVLPGARPRLTRASHLVGSGMNPGIVNALAFRGIAALAEKAGVEATAEAIGLTSILITEEDTTVELDLQGTGDAFPMTWSPFHCLEELFQADAIVARDGAAFPVGHAPHAAWYRARCGDRHVDGMLVPHEEAITLSTLFPGVEIGFVYRIPPASRHALARYPGCRRAEAWPVRKMYAPHATELHGSDRVGVLLCTEELGELWIGYDVCSREALRVGTGATQLQVAAGVLAGWNQLGRARGIHFVEDLDWREYLALVDSVLGRPAIVHDAEAAPKSLE